MSFTSSTRRILKGHLYRHDHIGFISSSPSITSITTRLFSSRIPLPNNFQVPEPKPLQIADGDYIGFLRGALATAVRLGAGVFVVGWSPFAGGKGPWPGTLGILRDGSTVLSDCARPKNKIILYEYEASPFCRKVREACSMLDLTVEYRPCPGARAGWSSDMAQKTGRRTVPFMIDGTVNMFESDDIINYLFDKYGPGKQAVPWMLKGDFARDSCAYAASLRGYAGSRLLPNVRKDINKLQPIELWGYEGSPFVRSVRETLNTLGMAHVMINCGRGSQNRDKLYEKTGRFQVPYIIDRNTGIEMFESSEIVKYLKATYTVQA